MCNSSPDRPAGLACAGTPVSSPQEARQKASEDLSRAVAVFPFAVKKLMARLNDQGVGASLVCWGACLPQRIPFWSSKILRCSEFLLLKTLSMEAEGPLPAGRGLEWQSLLAEPHFANASDKGSATYSHMVDLFVERHHQLWKVRVDCIYGSPNLLSHICLSCKCSFPSTASWQIAPVHC